LGLTLKPIKVN